MDSQKRTLKTLMTGLYYPAFLGTALVLFVNKLAVIGSVGNFFTDLTIYYGVVLIVYLSSAYLGICDSPDATYAKSTFILDLFTVIFIFFAFYYLGYFSPSNAQSVNIKWFYFCVAGIALTDLIWNELIGPRNVTFLLRILGVAAIILMLISGFIGWMYSWFNIISLIGLAGMVAMYMRKVTLTTVE